MVLYVTTTPRDEQFFHVALAQGEAEVAPDGVADDLWREAVAFVGGDERVFIHAPSIARPPSRKTNQLP